MSFVSSAFNILSNVNSKNDMKINNAEKYAEEITPFLSDFN